MTVRYMQGSSAAPKTIYLLNLSIEEFTRQNEYSVLPNHEQLLQRIRKFTCFFCLIVFELNLHCHCLAFQSGFVYFDMPFGLKREAWDQHAPSGEAFCRWIKKLSAVAGCERFYLAFVYRQDLFEEYRKACESAHLSTCIPWYWYKPNLNIENKSTINAVETIGISEYQQDGKYGLQKWPSQEVAFRNPLQRHNMLTIDGVTTRAKDTNGKVVNQHEKPPELLFQLNRRFGIRGSTVVIIGAGCGGDVVGAIPGPQQCTIALEPDPDQFKCLVRRITNLASPSKNNKDIKWIDGRANFDVQQEFDVVEASCLVGRTLNLGRKLFSVLNVRVNSMVK